MHQNINAIVCPIQRTATLIGDVTVIVILRELRMGPRRFGELLISGLNPRTLSHRLQRLTQEGIVDRTRYAESPPRVEYRLTPKGLGLLPVLQVLQTFGETWLPLSAAPFRNSSEPSPSAETMECGDESAYHSRQGAETLGSSEHGSHRERMIFS